MMISRASSGAVPLMPDPLREAAAVAGYESGTLESVGANIVQGYTDMGAGPLFRGLKVGNLEAYGTPIDEQEYKQSPAYREGLTYYKGMTKESAEELAKYNDEKQQRQFVTDRANTIGIGTTAYILGSIAEPINALAGVATMGVGTAMMSTKMAAHIASKSRIGARLGAYGTEGLVAAAVTEPFNRFGAGMLHDDYSMADSALNVVSSTILSAGLGTAGHFLEQRAKLRGAVKTYEQATEELDVATKQMIAGQEIDVRGVQKPVSKLPVEEKAAIVESFVKYTETPEFAARFVGSKALTPEGKPQLTYTPNGEGVWSFSQPDEASAIALRDNRAAAAVQPSYIDIKNPYSLEDYAATKGQTVDELLGDSNAIAYVKQHGNDIIDAADKAKYDGIIATDKDGVSAYAAFNTDKIIPAFGADDLDSIAARIDTDNAAVTQQAILKANDPTNSTAIDTQAADEVNAYAERYPDEGYQEELIQYEQEISAMQEQGLLSDEDIAMLEYVNTLNEEDVLRGYEAAFLCLTRG